MRGAFRPEELQTLTGLLHVGKHAISFSNPLIEQPERTVTVLGKTGGDMIMFTNFACRVGWYAFVIVLYAAQCFSSAYRLQSSSLFAWLQILT